MVLHDEFLNDGAYQQSMLSRAAVILQKFPFCFLSSVSKENYERSGNSRKMVFYYFSKRFPNMYMSSSFYEEIMGIVEMHVSFYRKYINERFYYVFFFMPFIYITTIFVPYSAYQCLNTLN